MHYHESMVPLLPLLSLDKSKREATPNAQSVSMLETKVAGVDQVTRSAVRLGRSMVNLVHLPAQQIFFLFLGRYLRFIKIHHENSAIRTWFSRLLPMGESITTESHPDSPNMPTLPSPWALEAPNFMRLDSSTKHRVFSST